ncbi:uncharacterized protein CMC5_078200 [Chondromyces crocatus]|uniref:Uncharacterized protein n=1 Tax=Chondromyces crocatus TaxID=52 RepID=A0A0K1ESH3_CHOCO|nr:uncharacterized protein CMC5_078200 [Chondromyces crocatus]
MVSQSFIGRDIFAEIWGLVVLSAAAAEIEDLRIPYGWIEHMRTSSP